ncbi:MAG: DUF4266 domain-containing protein [Bdellovibrionales bacterium]|nr:DUF4266 domain-containing protein [Bdellovibrionales bacterium]
MKTPLLILSLLFTLIVTGCSSVKPWQKENFAKRHMQFDPYPLDSSFTDHVHESREGSRGGRGIGAGGCGCN